MTGELMENFISEKSRYLAKEKVILVRTECTRRFFIGTIFFSSCEENFNNQKNIFHYKEPSMHCKIIIFGLT